MGGRTARWVDYAEMARTAEDIGFDSVWFVDHLLYGEGATAEPPQGVWECWSVLAGLAAVTQRVELAPLVTCTGYRNPTLLAKMADAVDEISGGRLILAIGSGWHDPEYRAFGFAADHKYARFEEAVTIIRGLLRDGAIDFEGTYYAARDCELRPRGPRGAGIPLMIGANGPKMLRLTARYADQWNTWLAMSRSDPDAFPADDALVDAACLDVGRDPTTLERTVSIMVDMDGRLAIPASMGPETARPLSGTPEEIAAAIRAFAALGVSHIQMYLLPNVVASLRAFEPVLRALGRT
jgi:alkanesulfonate monooxygenase SsuD/methylene tetrahydromethanopterin reductase-like flavin-dependent oxidoreductase (luciferase family)